MDMEQIFNAAREADRAKDGSSPYSRVLAGMVAVMGARGRAVTWQDLSGRWHYPLASATDQETAADVIVQLDAVARQWNASHPFEITDLINGRQSWRFEHATTYVHAMEDEARIEHAARELADERIRREHKGIRRNSKKYEELLAPILKKTIQAERSARRTRAKMYVDAAQKWVEGEHAALVKKGTDRIAWLKENAADLEALIPGGEGAAKYRVAADTLQRGLDAHLKRVTDLMLDLRTRVESAGR